MTLTLNPKDFTVFKRGHFYVINTPLVEIELTEEGYNELIEKYNAVQASAITPIMVRNAVQEVLAEQASKIYTQADLVSFGNYMVSEERQKLYATHPDYPNREMLVERLSQVHHADIENWKEKRKGGGK